MPNPSWVCSVNISQTWRSGFAPLSIPSPGQELHPEINRPTFVNVCDNRNNMPEGMSGKSLYCWMVHLFHQEVFPLPLLRCHPFSTKVKVCWKSVVCLDKKFFADLQRTCNGCSVRVFRTFRHALKTIAGFSINRKCDSRTHFRKKHNYREWNIALVYFLRWKLVLNGTPLISRFHNLSAAPITRCGDFLRWNLCQMFANNASFYSCRI